MHRWKNIIKSSL